MNKRSRFPLALDQVAAPSGKVSAARTAAPGPSKAEPMASVTMALASSTLRQRMTTRLTALLEPALAPQWHAVLSVMGQVPREIFVDPGLGAQAYEDTALPIGHGQTISKPSVVARMLVLALQGELALQRGHLGRVLDIGTGCGYQAALLSCLSPQVLSVERLTALHHAARANLDRCPGVRRDALRLVLGDGRLGHPPNAPYDTIIAAACGAELPASWMDQLSLGGRLIAPMAKAQGSETQVLVVVDRREQGFVQQSYEGVNFVPLESGVVRSNR